MIGYLVADKLDSHRRILVVDDSNSTAPDPTPPSSTYSDSYSNTCDSTLFYVSVPVPEDPEPRTPHINGDLRYLYRQPKKPSRLPWRIDRRNPIRQPCWRAGRWKSLT